ncbi:unnamed protein product, partial [Hapterophycus canaliculatus]
ARVSTGSYEAAVEGFRQASRLRPKKHSHFTCLGKVYLRWGGHADAALEALEESLRLEHTDVAANLAVKARVAVEKAKQWRASGPRPPTPLASAHPHPPHRSPEHLTKNAPAVQDFSKPTGTGPLVRMSTARVRGLLRSDSGAGGVAVISFDESNAIGGGVGTGPVNKRSLRGSGEGAADVGKRGARASGEARGGADGSLRDSTKNRTQFDEDKGDDEGGDDGDGDREAGTKLESSPSSSRHRKNFSGSSISSLIADENVGIVGASGAASPVAAAAAAAATPAPGIGVVARAVARVEFGP